MSVKEEVSSQSDGDLVFTTDLEPGACKESILVTTESFEEFANEMSRIFDDSKGIHGKISEIKKDVNDVEIVAEPSTSENNVKTDSMKQVSSSTSLQSDDAKLDTASTSSQESNSEDYLHNSEWLSKEKHVFILSSAGKPIYSRFGNEDKLAGLCGVIQALVSVVQDSHDVLRSINTPTCTGVFLVKGPLILAAVSKSNESETQLVLQLTYAYNQIISVLTQSQLTKIFEQRRNYDLRRLLSGAERLIDHLLNFMEREPAFLLGAVRCLPLALNVRETITNSIIAACSKVKDLVFAILIAGNQLITLVRMRKYSLHPSDIHLIFNLVRSSESFKTAESWTPICLPKFDSSGFLHAHVSYLSEDCQACLLLLTVQRDAFYTLSQAKQSITEKLRRSNCLVAINEAVQCNPNLPTSNPLAGIAVPEIRHFMYKCRNNAQLFTSDVADYVDKKDKAPVDTDVLNTAVENLVLNSPSDISKLPKMKAVDYLSKYRKACSQIHNTARPAKLIYEANSEETILAWITKGFELYITFDSLIEKSKAIYAVDKLLRWVKKEEDRLFIMNAPTF